MVWKVAGAPNSQKVYSDVHLPSHLVAPSGWIYSADFLHRQFLCLWISTVGLSPLKIHSQESLSALVKMRLKYLVESSPSAQMGSAISAEPLLPGQVGEQQPCGRCGYRELPGSEAGAVAPAAPSATPASGG